MYINNSKYSFSVQVDTILRDVIPGYLEARVQNLKVSDTGIEAAVNLYISWESNATLSQINGTIGDFLFRYTF